MYTIKTIWSLPFISIVALMVAVSVSAVSFPRTAEAARGGSPGYALMRCKLFVDQTSQRIVLQVIDVRSGSSAAADAIVDGGVDPGIDYINEYCEVAVQKFLVAGWEIHTIEFDGSGHERQWYYHFVAK
ncbi:MAG: hypothetical protein V7731_13440 [Amphritea sp.]